MRIRAVAVPNAARSDLKIVFRKLFDGPPRVADEVRRVRAHVARPRLRHDVRVRAPLGRDRGLDEPLAHVLRRATIGDVVVEEEVLKSNLPVYKRFELTARASRFRLLHGFIFEEFISGD